MDSVDQIIELSDRNARKYFGYYNPLTGEGSNLERTKVYLNLYEYVLVPDYIFKWSMFFFDLKKYKSLEDFCEQRNVSYQQALKIFNEDRRRFDFEYFCFDCAKVKDKESGSMVRLKLRYAQRKLILPIIKDWFVNHNPARLITVKSRQYGGSTAIQILFAWVQLYHRKYWNSTIVAHLKDASRNIRAMYSRMLKNLPKEMRKFSLTPFEGSGSTKIIKGRECVISVGSIQTPDAIRSDDIRMAHLSEVGLWKDTPNRKAEDLMQSLIGSIPMLEFTALVLESTAKGLGFFHKEWLRAIDGESSSTPVCVAWFEIDLYRIPFLTKAEKRKFAASLTDYEKRVLNLGATLEGLKWYREKSKEFTVDWLMKCEFPSDWHEAFTLNKHCVHDPQQIDTLATMCQEPVFRGMLKADALYGEDAINKSLHFVPMDTGDLWLWAKPDVKQNISDRYVVSMDIGGRSDAADWTVLSVIDRKELMNGGVEECIGTWRFHLDQDLSVWRAVMLSKYFNNAKLVVERNSLHEKGREGDHIYTILDEIVEHYNNIYYRDDPTKIQPGVPLNYGFSTNRTTKPDLVVQMNKRIRDFLYIENDKRALDEARDYEMKDDFSYGAIDGQHDDIYMSRAIGLKVSSKMPLPKLIKSYKPRTQSADIVRGASSF